MSIVIEKFDFSWFMPINGEHLADPGSDRKIYAVLGDKQAIYQAWWTCCSLLDMGSPFPLSCWAACCFAELAHSSQQFTTDHLAPARPTGLPGDIPSMVLITRLHVNQKCFTRLRTSSRRRIWGSAVWNADTETVGLDSRVWIREAEQEPEILFNLQTLKSAVWAGI